MFSNVSFDFSGRTALITRIGSAMGIGRALLHGFSQAGAQVAGCDFDEAGLSEVEADYPDGIFRRVDVRTKEEVVDFVQRVITFFGHIDILVNNAGIAPFCPIIDLEEAIWDDTFDTNVKGYFLFAQAVARQIVRQGSGGSIVNITSISVHESGEHKVHYCASKAAVGSLTKGLALEFARYGIRVNAVEPGTVDTPIVKEAYLQDLIKDLRDNPQFPIKRMATGEDIVGAALFLCSDAASYINGASILVDGGALAGGQLPDDVLQAYEMHR